MHLLARSSLLKNSSEGRAAGKKRLSSTILPHSLAVDISAETALDFVEAFDTIHACTQYKLPNTIQSLILQMLRKDAGLCTTTIIKHRLTNRVTQATQKTKIHNKLFSSLCI